MPRLAYFDCFSGVSGDMTLAALVSAGWPAGTLQGLPARLRLENVVVEMRTERRGPFEALRVEVHAPGGQKHRHLRHIEEILAAADLPGPVRDGARRVFHRLAAAEAHVHGSTIEKVHFHEVGAIDAIVDITGAILALADLGVDQVFASTLPLGGGTVTCEHGRIPVPAPATAHLLAGLPVRHGPVEAELVTPTGAALLAELVSDWGAPPPYRLRSTGVGAGSRDFPDHPNVLRVLLGDLDAAAPGTSTVAVLETAIDDETPQRLADLVSRLLEAGALDAMLAPTVMKKGRPGHWLVVVAAPSEADRLARLVLQHSSSLGIRMRTESRLELARRIEQVGTPWGVVEVKVATLPDGTERAFPEFESLRSLSAGSGTPLREISEAAVAAWRAGR